jgi:hypothetical protein
MKGTQFVHNYLHHYPIINIIQKLKKPFSFKLSTVSLLLQRNEVDTQTFCFLLGYLISWHGRLVITSAMNEKGMQTFSEFCIVSEKLVSGS